MGRNYDTVEHLLYDAGIHDYDACDVPDSDPFTLQSCVCEFRKRGHSLQEAIEIFHNNPARFLGQNPKFDIRPIRVETVENQPATLAGDRA